MSRSPASRKIPLALKISYTLFVLVLVPVYWVHHGPANVLWFSDIALLATAVALWLESPLLVSMQAVSVSLLEMAWILDFAVALLGGGELLGLAGYMFREALPVGVRLLSLFHVVLPFLLLWLVHRLGYDRRGWLAQSGLAALVLLLCYALTPPSENINWVFGPRGKPQETIPSGAYLILIMIAFPVCVYLPSHLALRALMPDRQGRASPSSGT